MSIDMSIFHHCIIDSPYSLEIDAVYAKNCIEMWNKRDGGLREYRDPPAEWMPEFKTIGPDVCGNYFRIWEFDKYRHINGMGRGYIIYKNDPRDIEATRDPLLRLHVWGLLEILRTGAHVTPELLK